MKKYITLLLLFCLNAQAELCPTVSELKQRQLRDWQAVDINNGTPATPNQFDQFIQHVSQLALAEWMQDAPEGPGHCYYKSQSGSDYLDVFLAHQHLVPHQPADGWISLNPDVMQCHPFSTNCLFDADNRK